jgi:hypothetical protein
MRNICVFAIVVLLASCAPREKLICRSWKFKDVEFPATQDSASAAFTAMARQQMLSNINFTMETDSTYTIWQLKGMIPTRGKWWFSADKKQLFTETDLGLTPSKVIKLTKSSLVFESKDPSGKPVRLICVAIGPEGSK